LTKLQQISAAAQCEWRTICKDPWLRALTLWLPPVLILALWLIFSAGIPNDLPTGIIDLDRSSLSRALIRDLDASSTLKISSRYSSMREGTAALRSGSVYALVVIPHNFEVSVLRQKSPVVTAFFNSQYLLVAKVIRATIYEIVTYFSVELEVASLLPLVPVVEAAVNLSMPISAQMTQLYNQNFNYTQFLLPGLIVAFFQVSLCSLAVLSIGQSFKPAVVSEWYGKEVWPELAGKLLPYTAVFFIFGLAVLFLFFELLDWPLQGALLPLAPLLLLFIISCLALGVFFFVTTFELELGLIAASGFSGPAFAFLGVTFPVSDMAPFPQLWRNLMPAGHFIDGFIHQANYAAGPAGLVQPALILALFCLLLPLAVLLIKRRVEHLNDQISAAA